MKDVYVTDHTPKDKKYFTTNAKEDEEFYRYKQSLAEYNSSINNESKKNPFAKYEKGSLLQRIFDPFAGVERLPNGAIFYKVED